MGRPHHRQGVGSPRDGTRTRREEKQQRMVHLFTGQPTCHLLEGDCDEHRCLVPQSHHQPQEHHRRRHKQRPHTRCRRCRPRRRHTRIRRKVLPLKGGRRHRSRTYHLPTGIAVRPHSHLRQLFPFHRRRARRFSVGFLPLLRKQRLCRCPFPFRRRARRFSVGSHLRRHRSSHPPQWHRRLPQPESPTESPRKPLNRTDTRCRQHDIQRGAEERRCRPGF